MSLKILRAGFLFFFFALICISGDMLLVPVVFLGLNKFKFMQNLCRDLVRVSWGFFIKVTKICGYLDYKFELTKLNGGSNLVIANHPSLLDVVFLVSKFKRINCIVKGELGKNIFLFAAIRACNYIPNTNNEEFLQKSVDVLKSGENLLIFPEGTRTKEEIIFHKAAAYMGIKGASNVLCVGINMAPRSLRKNEPWYKTPDEKIRYVFKELKKFEVSEFLKDRPSPVRARALHEEISKIYKEEFSERTS